MVRKLTNPCKRFFLQLAANAIKDVNRFLDSNNMSYAKKAMIRCGLTLGIDGTLTTNQLFLHLQEIIAKHHLYFHKKEVLQLP